MALFGSTKETKEEKEARRVQELMQKYGLENISKVDADSIERILGDLAGKNLIRTGLALSGVKAEDQVKMDYLSALMEQNWIIIRQLDRISKILISISKK